jgi:hypothetical protein
MVMNVRCHTKRLYAHIVFEFIAMYKFLPPLAVLCAYQSDLYSRIELEIDTIICFPEDWLAVSVQANSECYYQVPVHYPAH